MPQIQGIKSDAVVHYSNPEIDEMLEAQRIETDSQKRAEMLRQIARKINLDVPFFYRGGRRQHIVARKKIMDLTDISEIKINLVTAWIDEAVKFNSKAFEIEQNIAVSVDCPDPGDTKAVKAIILGSWEGKDDWGATIEVMFKDNSTVTGSRTGSTGGTRKYVICGPDIHWEALSGAKLVVTLTEDNDSLNGKWNYSLYSGNFTLRRK